MKSITFLFVFIVFTVSVTFAGEPVPGAEVFVEQEPDEEPIAFQKTGNSGTVTFGHLDKGMYRILITLPQQKGKLARGADKFDENTKSSYNTKKQSYLLHEKEGFFSVDFVNLKKIKDSKINPVYKVEKNRNGKQIVIATFKVDGKIGEITLKIEALTSKEFSSKAKKVKNDTAKAVIRNIR